MTEIMTLEEALELAVETLISQADVHGDRHSKWRQAAAMLRDGGTVVEKRLENRKMRRCTRCRSISNWNKDKCECGCVIAKHHYLVMADMNWTEREKLQIATEKSEPTFEEVKP